MCVIGRRCAAFYKGGWKDGKIVTHNIKEGFCLIETKTKYGTIKVDIYKIRMTDKEE